jgi:Photoprotection regulator fluorescence recovery protein
MQSSTIAMPQTETEWSETEQKVARRAFDTAYENEITTLVRVVQEQMHTITTSKDIWHLHDLLSSKRHELDGKYDYRYPGLIWVFAELVRDGWIQITDLEGLDRDKLTKISVLARMQG